MRDYREVATRLRAICQGERDEIALMATFSQELFASFDGFDWVGFYRVVSPNILKIGPYQGGHGCLTIPFDKGVCGAAARTATPQLVADVEQFDGHIACASSTRSELVIPLMDNAGGVRAVLDIDSDPARLFQARRYRCANSNDGWYHCPYL
jgi:GAF domain-containing protein